MFNSHRAGNKKVPFTKHVAKGTLGNWLQFADVDFFT
ncbi:hypothetical protein DES53_104178 [Roseimicrobium gellanilyticum]|uniref:Uncharacterized protein n=1 Tax=Roseimicrobium gellanilyticum TaxID=748857 RepID=A0A366HMJ2_9BACT|nr:hypothetical protein DES53_104178 [Roseimicrobium gellanilyticum]